MCNEKSQTKCWNSVKSSAGRFLSSWIQHPYPGRSYGAWPQRLRRVAVPVAVTLYGVIDMQPCPMTR